MVVLRVSLVLLIGTLAFGLARNLPVLGARLLLPASPLPTGDPPLRFVVVAPEQDHPFWAQVGEGARAAGARLNVSVEFSGPRRASLEGQVQLLDMAAAAQVDGIITQGAPDERIGQAIARAADRGIPVITVETDLPGRRLTYVGSDNYAAGRLAAGELLRRTGGRAVVGIVRGHFGPEEEDDRVRGFRDGLAGAPGVRIAAVAPSSLSRTVAGQQALRILREHPEVTAFYGTTALDAVGIAQSVSALVVQDRILVLGWDTPGETETGVSRGAIGAVVVQQPARMGQRAVELLEAYLRRDVRPAGPELLPVTLRAGGGSGE